MAEGKNLRVVIVDDEEQMRSGVMLMLATVSDIDVVGEASNGRDAVDVVVRESPDVVLMDIRMPVANGIEAVRMLASAQPNADERAAVIMLTAFDTDAFIMDALRAGAIGFLLKTTPPDALAAAVRAAADGQQIMSPSVVERLVGLAQRRELGEGPDAAAADAAATGAAATGAAVTDGPAAQAPSAQPVARYSTAGVESSRAPQAGGSREVAQRKLALLSDREFEVAECIAQGLGNADIASRLFVSLTTVKTHIKHILDKVGGTNRVHIAITVLEAR